MCLEDPALLQKPLEGVCGIALSGWGLGAAWRAVHGPSIPTHCPARGGTQGPNSPLLTRSDGTVMGASGWSNDLGENFLWEISPSASAVVSKEKTGLFLCREKIGHLPSSTSSTPPSSPQGFIANIRSLDRRSISGDCALRTKTSSNIFKHFPAEVGVERKQRDANCSFLSLSSLT